MKPLKLPGPSKRKQRVIVTLSILIAIYFSAYIIYFFICRQSASKIEATVEQPGDHIIQHSTTGYTLAKTIRSPCSKIWRWLIQMGQGRGGFYTHEWVENLMGANIHNADSILPQFQKLSKGDSIRLTPDPYFGKPGQYLVLPRLILPILLFLNKFFQMALLARGHMS